MTGERNHSKTPDKVCDLRVERALRAVQQQPARRFRVQDMAKLAGASRASFVRLFRAATGTSPQRWLTERRLERAAALLVTTEQTLAQIAEQVGYLSEFSFSRAFKRHHGLAPAHYRQAGTQLRCAA